MRGASMRRANVPADGIFGLLIPRIRTRVAAMFVALQPTAAMVDQSCE